MIEIRLSEENFEYDIYSLVKAFYPQETVGREPLTGPGLIVDVCYEKNSIRVTLKDEAADGDHTAVSSVSIENADRTEVKSRLKRVLYRLLQDKTGKILPWGTLTGIRPTKIPYAMLEEGKKEEDIVTYMKDMYLASDEKIRLSLEIAKREREILKSMDYRNGYSLYVGIPFCPTRCLYCSFTSYPLKQWQRYTDAYVDALCREIRSVSELMEGRSLDTLYIGGGTPTTLEPEQMDRLLSQLEEAFDLSGIREFTAEAGRPDSVTAEKLKVFKNHDVSRISVNPQTMKQETLDIIGRMHTVEQTREAFYLARDCGFQNINMDLISGLPGEGYRDMEHTMKEIKKLGPDSVTVHALAIKRASRLHELWEEYKDCTKGLEEDTSRMMEACAREMGLLPYYLYRQKNMAGNLENVGYAAPHKAGIYNILIMEEKQTILAVGAGASTKLVFDGGQRIERIENVKSVEQYIGRIDEMIERKRRGMLIWQQESGRKGE